MSRDLRGRGVRAVEGGPFIRRAALRFEAGPSAAVEPMRRVRETGSAAPRQTGGHRRPVLEPHEAPLRNPVAAEGGITLAEIRTERRARGVVVRVLSTIHQALRRLDLARRDRA